MIDPGQIAQPMPPPSDPRMAMAPAMGAPPPLPAPPGAEPALPAMGPVPGEAAPPEKKPPLLLPPKVARALAEGYVEQVRSMASMIADQVGPPDDFEKFKVKERVRAWYKRNPSMDPIALKEQGLSPVEIRDKVYPLRRVLLKMVGPSPTARAKFAAQMKASTPEPDAESPSLPYDSPTSERMF